MFKRQFHVVSKKIAKRLAVKTTRGATVSREYICGRSS